MIVWFTPAMMLGNASGIWTPNSFCRSVMPKESAASMTSRSTSRIPRSVSRITGTIA